MNAPRSLSFSLLPRSVPRPRPRTQRCRLVHRLAPPCLSLPLSCSTLQMIFSTTGKNPHTKKPTEDEKRGWPPKTIFSFSKTGSANKLTLTQWCNMVKEHYGDVENVPGKRVWVKLGACWPIGACCIARVPDAPTPASHVCWLVRRSHAAIGGCWYTSNTLCSACAFVLHIVADGGPALPKNSRWLKARRAEGFVFFPGLPNGSHFSQGSWRRSVA
jgi:hypothetical protein